MDNMNNNVNVEPAYNATPAAPAQDNSMKTMIFGILGLVFSELGILGLIFSILGKKEAKKFEAAFGQLTGKAKVGAILSKIGFILSIVMTVFWVIYFLVCFIIGLAAASYAMY